MNDQRLFVLESFGLSGYLARAYVALLDLGPAQARDVAERSAVPQGRIYDVLEKLHARGLIELLPEAPKRYRALAFQAFIERELSFHTERARLLERQRDDILTTMQPRGETRQEVAEYLVIRGRRAVLERITALIQESEDVLSVGTEATGLKIGLYEEALRESIGRGATHRTMLPVTKANRAAVEQAAQWGVQVRHRDSSSAMTLTVFDGRRALLYRTPTDPALKGQDAAAILLEEPELAQGLRDIGERMWFRGISLEERLRELDTGQRAGDLLVYRRLADVRAAAEQSLAEAQREVRIQMPADLLPHALPGWEATLRGLQERKVRARVLLSARTPEENALAQRIAALGAEVRNAPEAAMSMLVQDDERAYLVLTDLLRRTLGGRASAEIVLAGDGADIVASLAQQFETAWTTGVQAKRGAEAPQRLPPA